MISNDKHLRIINTPAEGIYGSEKKNDIWYSSRRQKKKNEQIIIWYWDFRESGWLTVTVLGIGW